MIDSTLIILTIYKTRIDESIAFRSLTKTILNEGVTGSIFIYDNSPSPQPIPAHSVWSIYYHHDPSNPGVSTAYNRGLERAKKLSKEWILISDDDTHFPDNFFGTVRTAIANYPCDLLAPRVMDKSLLISPFKFRRGKGHVLKSVDSDSLSFNSYRFINSGLVVSTRLFEKCNGYDERFPLDFSDLVFAKRVAKHQNHFRVINTICEHQLSTEGRDYLKSVKRFKYYLIASKLYAKDYGDGFFIYLYRIIRTSKLSLKFKSLKFVKLLLQS